MKRTIQLAAAVFFLAAAPATVHAQVDIEGSTSFSIGAFAFLGADNGSVNGTFGINRFLSGGIELGGFVSLNATYASGGSSTTSGFTFGKIRYNKIGESMTVPFVEFGAGTQLDSPGEGASRPFLLQTGLGMKRFINDQVSFDLTGNVQGTYANGSLSVTEALFVTYQLTVYLK